MPSLADLLARRAGVLLHFTPAETVLLEKRINLNYSVLSPPGLIEAETRDPWNTSGKYALGWLYFSLVLLISTAALHWYHYWNDKTRVAWHKERHEQYAEKNFFPQEPPVPPASTPELEPSTLPWVVKKALAFCRYVFYRPIPTLRIHHKLTPIVFPPIGVLVMVLAALAGTLSYCFVPQPLYWQSIEYGSPPLAIRSGMIAVALMPWIVALGSKLNFISILTGIGHERLNVLHRWLAYLCLVLSIVHTLPFYLTPIDDDRALQHFHRLLKMQQSGVYIYGTGIAALVPLAFLCIHSLAPLRRMFYELFVVVHVPAAMVFLGLLFWHCHNYLTSWHYLWSTVAIWLASYVLRLFYLNWARPGRVSFGIGEEATVTILEENAVKVTIPTQMRWRPGQYVYLRMPGVSFFENHPFTIASLCSDDYPSEQGDDHRDMVLVFRPFGGFTKKLLDAALDHGPWWTYHAFIDGPYGGMRRQMHAFDHVVLVAGGTGITAIVSHLLDLITRMRDGKAVTQSVHLIWALKRPETMEWFKEELRICRDLAPPDSLSCQFYITAAKRQAHTGQLVSAQTPGRPVSTALHDKVNTVFHHIAHARAPATSPHRRPSLPSSHRHSALIRDAAGGDPDREHELRAENEDRIRPLPQAHLKPTPSRPSHAHPSTSRPPPHHPDAAPIAAAPAPTPTRHKPPRPRPRPPSLTIPPAPLDFGFPRTPTELQKNLMRFAFLPGALAPAAAAPAAARAAWTVQWGRPDLPYMLHQLQRGPWTRRPAAAAAAASACVFVCGPPAMRRDVGRAVAHMQPALLRPGAAAAAAVDEIYLHTENYAL